MVCQVFGAESMYVESSLNNAVKGQEAKAYEERLRELNMLSLEKKRWQDDIIPYVYRPDI